MRGQQRPSGVWRVAVLYDLLVPFQFDTPHETFERNLVGRCFTERLASARRVGTALVSWCLAMTLHATPAVAGCLGQGASCSPQGSVGGCADYSNCIGENPPGSCANVLGSHPNHCSGQCCADSWCDDFDGPGPGGVICAFPGGGGPSCGDGTCDPGEDSKNCCQDCPPTCSNSPCSCLGGCMP